MKVMALIGLLSLAIVGPAPAETLNLTEALDLALDQHPVLSVALAETEAAEAAARQAGAWSNPALFFRMEGAPREGGAWSGSERIVGLSQELSLFGERRAATALGRAEADLARKGLALERRDLEARVRQTYAAAWQAQQTLMLRAEATEVATKLGDMVSRRFRAGDASEAEERRARMAVGMARAEEKAASARSMAAMTELSMLLGSSPSASWELAHPTTEATMVTSEGAPSEREALLQARNDVAEAAASAADRKRWPGLELEAGLRTSPDGDAFDLGVRMGLPLWNRGSQGVKEARALQAAEQYRSQALFRDLQARREAARTHRQAAAEALALYSEVVVPNAEASLQAAETAFQVGDVGLTEVLQVTREWIGARQGQLDWILALAKAEAEAVRLR